MARKKKGNTVSVDMTGVESSGRVGEGPNLLTVEGVSVEEGPNGDYLNWTFKASTGGKVWENTSLTPQSLWKLRGLLEALGLEVPDGTLDLDLEEYVGLELGAEIEHEVYQGKKKGVIVDMFPADQVEGGGESEGDEGGDSGSGTDPEFDLEELEDDDLRSLAIEMKLTTKVKAKKLKTTKKLLALFEDEAEEDILAAAIELELVEGEPEEEEKPAKKSSKKTTKKKGGKIEKGSKVSFEDDDEEYEGEVIKINKKKGVYTVETDDAEWELEVDDLTLVE